jgi:hypothetical protein
MHCGSTEGLLLRQMPPRSGRMLALTHAPKDDLTRRQEDEASNDRLRLMPDGDGAKRKDDGDAESAKDIPHCKSSLAHSKVYSEDEYTFGDEHSGLARDLK